MASLAPTPPPLSAGSTLALPTRSSAPFRLPGSRASALLVHGFTGCPIEVRLVGDALSEHGVEAVAPLLPGHGEADPLVLNRTRWERWLDAVRVAWDELDPSRPRFLVGSSMGGALALLLAAELQHRIDGLVLLAPALTLMPMGQLGAVLARRGFYHFAEALPKEDPGGDCADPEGRAANAGYPVLPVKGIIEFDRARQAAGRALPGVLCPVATFHGRDDRTIDPVSSEQVAGGVSSPWVERTVLPRSRHLIGLDYDRATVCRGTVRFVERVLAAKGASR